MKTKEVTISVNWDNPDSIKLAEKNKLSLENRGYSLVNNFGGMRYSTFVYMKKLESRQ